MPKRSASLANRTQEYSTFLKDVKLYIIALDSVESTIDRQRYWACDRGKGHMVRAVDASYEAEAVEGTHFNVLGRFEMKLLNKLDNGELLKIRATFSTHFHAPKRIDKHTAQRFANAEAKIIIWPYFRQLVSDITARMYIPPVTVPISLDSDIQI